MKDYPYPFLDKAGKIICQLCGKPFLVISPQHLKIKHNIKYNEYILRFPDAPVSSNAFSNVTKYGKHKTFFVEQELSKFEEEAKLDDLNDKFEEIYVDEEPEIEDEISLTKALNPTEKTDNIVVKNKNKMLDHLRSFFTNVQKDYRIIQYGSDGIVKFVYITDFCDPVLKIVIQFPDTFWHNREQWYVPNKKQRLEEYGWKVIEIKSNCPSFKDVTKSLRS